MGNRKVRVGRVISDKMQKTVVVAVEWRQPHPKDRKLVRRLTKFKAHNADSRAKLGDLVEIMETRPLSKEKRWRVLRVVVKGEVAEIQPEEVGATQLQEGIEHRREEPAVEAGQPAPATAEATA